MVNVELKNTCVALCFSITLGAGPQGQEVKMVARANKSGRFSAKFNEVSKTKKKQGSIIFLSAFVGIFVRCYL